MARIGEKNFTQIEDLKHTVLIGPTGAGKTRYVYQLLTDKKIPLSNEFVLCSLHDQIDAFAKSYAAHLALHDQPWQEAKMLYFKKGEELQKTIDYCKQSPVKKLAVFDDSLLTPEGLRLVSGFVHEARHFNTQCIIISHKTFEGEEMKKIRAACRYIGIFNEDPKTVSLMINKPLNSPILNKYLGTSNRYDRMILIDKDEQELYARDYTPYTSIKTNQMSENEAVAS